LPTACGRDLPASQRSIGSWQFQVARLAAGSGGGRQPAGVSPADFDDWRREVKSLDHLAAWTGWLADLSGEGEPERLPACLVTANFFLTLGVRPEHGTLFSADANEVGANDQVMLSHGFWQRRFGGDTNIIGRTIRLTHRSHTVVGIMPDQVQYPPGVELWAPLKLGMSEWRERDTPYLRMVGRLKAESTATRPWRNCRRSPADFRWSTHAVMEPGASPSGP
jgi:hypothetical protein